MNFFQSDSRIDSEESMMSMTSAGWQSPVSMLDGSAVTTGTSVGN